MPTVSKVKITGRKPILKKLVKMLEESVQGRLDTFSTMDGDEIKEIKALTKNIKTQL